jgi:chemotaxis protein CheX
MKGSAGSIALASELDIKAAAPLATELIAVRGTALTIDASGVERIGGQCMQVLLAAAEIWRTDGSSLSIAEPSAAFVAAIGTAGLDITQFTTGTN